MALQRTVKSGTHALHRFVSGQGAVGFGDAALAVRPLGFNRIEPRAFDGQRADQEPNPFPRVLDELVMLTYQLTNRFAEMPRGIVPNDDQHRFAQRLSFDPTPFQELDSDSTDGTIPNETQPHLLLSL